MELSAFERLPDLVQFTIVELLSEESPSSLLALALANRSCHDAASPFLYRHLTIEIRGEDLWQTIQRCITGPCFARRAFYARTLRFSDLMNTSLNFDERDDYKRPLMPREDQWRPLDGEDEGDPMLTDEEETDESDYSVDEDEDEDETEDDEDKPSWYETLKLVASGKKTHFYMPDGRPYMMDGPLHQHGYASLMKLAPRTALDHTGKFASSKRFWHWPIPSAHEAKATGDPLVQLIQSLDHLQHFIWESKCQLPLSVLQALEKHHSSVTIDLAAHRFISVWDSQMSANELALASSPLVREVTSYCVSFKYVEDASMMATIKSLRTLPSLRVLHCHGIEEMSNSCPVGYQFSVDTNGKVWNDFNPLLNDTGPAKLETLILSGNSGSRYERGIPKNTLQKIVGYIDLQSLKSLDLGWPTNVEDLRMLTGISLLPRVRHLGLDLDRPVLRSELPMDPGWLENFRLVLQDFIASLPPLEQIAINHLPDEDWVWIILEKSSSTLRDLKSLWTLMTPETINALCINHPGLQRLSISLDYHSHTDYVERAEILARLPALKFCEVYITRRILRDEEVVEQLWKRMTVANAAKTGTPSLMGLKVNLGSFSSPDIDQYSVVITRSERDDAELDDFRTVRIEPLSRILPL